MLVLMHSIGLYSAAGTCFSAAAWIDIVDAAHRQVEALAVTHVADEVADAVLIEHLLISHCFISSREKITRRRGL